MTIQGGKIYDILRTYNKQVKYSKASAHEKSSPEKSLDKVSISTDAKKLAFISDILAEIGNSDKETLQKVGKLIGNVDFGKTTDEELDELKKDILDSF
jgi:hypothetical protein